MTGAARSSGAGRVLVTDAGRGSSISVIRSLGGAGWHVTAGDADRYSPGFYSRYTGQRLRYPAPGEDRDRFAEVIHDAVRRHRIDLLVPVTDDVILGVLSIRDELEATARLALPSTASFELAADKIATDRLAGSLGIATPRSIVIEGPVHADGIATGFAWPVVVKPARSRTRRSDGTIGRHTVDYAADAAELGMLVRRAEGPVMVQEYVPGEGHGVELLIRDGEPLAAFQHRRLREVPVTGGASAFRESVSLDPTLLDQSVALLTAMDWSGLAMVEFRVGPTGARLMEVNGRIWGSLPLAVRAGVDFPRLMADHHMGRPVLAPPLGSYRLGVRSRNLPLELSWIGNVLTGRRRSPLLEMPSRMAGLAAALRLPAPDGWDVQSWSDPAPGLVEIERLAERSALRLARMGRNGTRP